MILSNKNMLFFLNWIHNFGLQFQFWNGRDTYVLAFDRVWDQKIGACGINYFYTFNDTLLSKKLCTVSLSFLIFVFFSIFSKFIHFTFKISRLVTLLSIEHVEVSKMPLKDVIAEFEDDKKGNSNYVSPLSIRFV
mgnify:CR=1 FL=1